MLSFYYSSTRIQCTNLFYILTKQDRIHQPFIFSLSLELKVEGCVHWDYIIELLVFFLTSITTSNVHVHKLGLLKHCWIKTCWISLSPELVSKSTWTSLIYPIPFVSNCPDSLNFKKWRAILLALLVSLKSLVTGSALKPHKSCLIPLNLKYMHHVSTKRVKKFIRIHFSCKRKD
jgi:hypothetical protein